MSYSIMYPCHNCSKKESCTDAKDVQAAVTAIHNKNYESGHQGAGTIVLSCTKMDAIYK